MLPNPVRCRYFDCGLATVGGSRLRVSLVDPLPGERRPGRQSRAIALIAVAFIGVAFACAAYLRSNAAPQVQAQGGQISMPSVPSSPPPRPRSVGIIRVSPVSITIEQFGGLNDQPPNRMTAWAQVTNVNDVNRLVSEFNALPAFPAGAITCPMDDGSHYALVFRYADHSTADVKVAASGCLGVYIGESTEAVAWTLTSSFVDTLQGFLAQLPQNN